MRPQGTSGNHQASKTPVSIAAPDFTPMPQKIFVLSVWLGNTVLADRTCAIAATLQKVSSVQLPAVVNARFVDQEHMPRRTLAQVAWRTHFQLEDRMPAPHAATGVTAPHQRRAAFLALLENITMSPT